MLEDMSTYYRRLTIKTSRDSDNNYIRNSYWQRGSIQLQRWRKFPRSLKLGQFVLGQAKKFIFIFKTWILKILAAKNVEI